MGERRVRAAASAAWRRRPRSRPVLAGAAGLVAAIAAMVVLTGGGDGSAPVASPSRAPGRSCPSLSSTPAGPRATGSAAPVQGVVFDQAKRVLQQSKDQIRSRYPGVVGTGIGSVVRPHDRVRAGRKVYGIIVFLDKKSRRPPAGQSIEGVPLRFEVSRRYRALPGPICPPR